MQSECRTSGLSLRAAMILQLLVEDAPLYLRDTSHRTHGHSASHFRAHRTRLCTHIMYADNAALYVRDELDDRAMAPSGGAS